LTEDTHTRALEACRNGVKGEHENIALKPIFPADFAPHDAGMISARLRQRRMLLTPLNDPRLRCGSMRVATALPEENWRFLEALREVLTVS